MANDFYGGATVGYTADDVQDDTGPEGHADGLLLSGFAGVGFSNDIYLEFDARYRDVNSVRRTAFDGLGESQVYALRMGKQFTSFSAEAFYAYIDAETYDGGTSPEGNSERHALGVIGQVPINQKVSLSGTFGYLFGNDGSDDGGRDAFRDMWHGGFGVHAALTDRWTAGLNVLYGEGTVDDDNTRNETGTVLDYSFDLRYRFLSNPNIEAFGRVGQSRYFQGAPENDNAKVDRFEFGITIALGNKGPQRSRNRVEIPDYETWIATSAGVLE